MTKMLIAVQRLLFLLLLQRMTAAAAFASRTAYVRRSSAPARSSIGSSRATTTLFYKDDGKDNSDIHNQQQTGYADTISIPVLGPLPGQAPLLIGAELTLEPTPLQWQAVEETIRIHQTASHPPVGSSNNTTSTTAAAAPAAATTAASIQAAPLIAIMDEYTAPNKKNSQQQELRVQGRYATIAAVVGIGSSNNNNNNSDEETDESSSSLSKNSRTTPKTVRLLGVGRALLQDFFYQVPTSLATDEEGHLLTESGERLSDLPLLSRGASNDLYPSTAAAAADDPAATEYNMDGNDDEDEEENDDDDDNPYANDSPMNIVMANFCVMNDTYLRHVKSPVHAVAAMSALAFKLQFLHEDRRKLVAGIQAAIARLKQAHQRQAEAAATLQTAAASVEEESEEEEEDLIDHDGIGLLFETKLQQDATTAAVLFRPKLKMVKKKKDKNSKQLHGPSAAAAAAAATTPPQAPPPSSLKQSSPVAKLDNYGLGTQAASFSAVPDLTNVYLEKLQPYYSPARCASEEHYYEVLSFVSILALEPFLEPTQTGWSLQCLNTLERMEQAYEWMWNHVRMLKEEVERLSEDLRQCGEECTDLW